MTGSAVPLPAGPLSRDRWLKLLVPFVVAIAVLAYQSSRASWKVREALLDDLRIAHHTIALGTLADAAKGERPRPTRALPPGHPYLIAAFARLDPSLARSLECFASEQRACERNHAVSVLLAPQALATVLCLALICLIGFELSGSKDVATLTMLLALLLGHFGEFVRYVGPDSYINAALFGSLYALLRAQRSGSIWVFALAGAMLGIGALFRPHFICLGLLAAPVIFWALRRAQVPAGRSIAAAAAYALACLLVTAPWMLRNLARFGDAALVDQDMAMLLARRLAYNSMTFGEWWLSLVYWMPGIGVGSFDKLYPLELAHKLGGAHTGATPQPAALALYDATLKAAGTSAAHVGHLLRAHLAADLWQHLVTTVPVLNKGMWGSTLLLVAVAMLYLPRLVRTLRATGRLDAFALLAGVSVALLVLQALLTHNGYWINLQMVLLYSFALAHAAGGL